MTLTHTHTHTHTLLHISWGRESTTELWHTHTHTKMHNIFPHMIPYTKGFVEAARAHTHTHTHSDNIPALTLSHITFSSHTHTHTHTHTVTLTHTHTLRRSIPLCLDRQNESEEAAASHLQMGSGLSEDFQRRGELAALLWLSPTLICPSSSISHTHTHTHTHTDSDTWMNTSLSLSRFSSCTHTHTNSVNTDACARSHTPLTLCWSFSALARAPSVQHMRKCIMSPGSPLHSSCPPPTRSTGILPFSLREEVLQCVGFFFCFFFPLYLSQGSVSWTEENTTGKNVWCRIPAINKKKGGEKKKKGKNGKRVLIH